MFTLYYVTLQYIILYHIIVYYSNATTTTTTNNNDNNHTNVNNDNHAKNGNTTRAEEAVATTRWYAPGRLERHLLLYGKSPMKDKRLQTICVSFYLFIFFFKWIPFGDHPLNLERYRED